MLCTFCGTDNSPENKFCGMCGVKLERRKVERRVRHGAASLKCASCGHVCEAGSTFCGMCGARIERRLSTRRAVEERATAIANVQLPSPDIAEGSEAAAASEASPSPGVENIPAKAAEPTGSPEPELPAVAPTAQASPRSPAAIFRSDSPAERSTPPPRSTIGGPSFLGLNDGPGDSGDYLLEDEKPSRSFVRFFVLLAIMAVVLGLVLVQWRPGLLASLKTLASSKTAPAPSPQVGQPKPETSPTPEAVSTPSVAEPSPTPAPASASEKTAPDQPDVAKPSAAPAPADETSKASSDDATSRAAKSAARREKDTAREEAQSLKPSAALLKAQDYLQGRNGVKQDCDQAMTYLRAAVQRSEPAAAMQMGELYATGRCVQQDRVTAYRWMNSAREKAPGNTAIQATVDQLWGRMTPQERKDAGH